MCSWEGECASGSFLLRVLKAEGLSEVLGKISIEYSSALLSALHLADVPNEIYSLNFIRLWVWLANSTNWISAITQSRMI